MQPLIFWDKMGSFVMAVAQKAIRFKYDVYYFQIILVDSSQY